MDIRIDGLEIYAYHGVLPEEKILGQPFVFDIELLLADPSLAALTDRVEDTVNYAEVVEVVHQVVTAESFNLLEKLAAEVSEAILDRFTAVQALEVRVRKPRPPIARKLDSVEVGYQAVRALGPEEPEEPLAGLAYLGLGSNEGDSRRMLSEAIAALGRLPGIESVEDVSSLYRTAPIGVEEQADYLNLVVSVSSHYSLSQLLAACQGIEAMAGRVRRMRWGPRPLDIDVLLHLDNEAHHPDLEVPHPEIEKRRFVLEPLAEIAPGLLLPSGRTVEEALALVMDQRVERLGPAPGE